MQQSPKIPHALCAALGVALDVNFAPPRSRCRPTRLRPPGGTNSVVQTAGAAVLTVPASFNGRVRARLGPSL